MTISKEQKADLIKEFGGSETNTGSSDVQIALLSHRISELTEHLKIHKKDHHSRRGLLKLVAQRSKLLKYVANNDIEHYRQLTDKLGIRRKK